MRSRHYALEFGCRSVLYERAENCHCVPRPDQTICRASDSLGHGYPARRKRGPVESARVHTATPAGTQTRRDVRMGLHPILHWSHAEVFAFLLERNQPLHVAYSAYGCSRVSCAFCVLSSRADLAAASRCERNQNVYRKLVALEAESSFPFSPVAGWATSRRTFSRPILRATSPGPRMLRASGRYWKLKSRMTCCSQRACRAGCLIGVKQGY